MVLLPQQDTGTKKWCFGKLSVLVPVIWGIVESRSFIFELISPSHNHPGRRSRWKRDVDSLLPYLPYDSVRHSRVDLIPRTMCRYFWNTYGLAIEPSLYYYDGNLAQIASLDLPLLEAIRETNWNPSLHHTAIKQKRVHNPHVPFRSPSGVSFLLVVLVLQSYGRDVTM